jgi:hypothetical protein
MLTPANLFGAILFGTIGLAAFVYGKKQGLAFPMLFGAALMLYPYFVTQTWLLYGLGILLTMLVVQFRDR